MFDPASPVVPQTPTIDPTQTAALVPAPPLQQGFTPAVPPQAQAARQAPRPIAPNVEMTDLNDESVKKYEFELYSGKMNQTDRIFVPASGHISKAWTHFVEGANKASFICLSERVKSPDGKQETLVKERECCKRLGSATQRFATLVVHYGTDRNGGFVEPFSMALKLWKFGADKYLNLRQVNSNFPLGKHDLSVTCTEEKYQRLVIGGLPDCWLRHPQLPAEQKDRVVQWVNASVNKIHKELGRTFENEQAFLQFLTAPGAGPVGPAPAFVQRPTDAPVSSFDDIIVMASPTT